MNNNNNNNENNNNSNNGRKIMACAIYENGVMKMYMKCNNGKNNEIMSKIEMKAMK
jgi:hypothetical protein